jgi:hypothetical protein
MIFDNDISSMYPMTWMGGKHRPRTLELRIREDLAPQKYTVYVSGGDWWEEGGEMAEWCAKCFGPRSSKYNNPRWSQGSFEFRFKNKKDATFFILRWS